MKIESSYRGGCDAQGNAVVTVESPAEIAAALVSEWGGVVERDREWLRTVVAGRYLLWSPEQVEAIVEAILEINAPGGAS